MVFFPWRFCDGGLLAPGPVFWVVLLRLGVLFCLWLCVGRWPFLGPGSLLFVCSFGSVGVLFCWFFLGFYGWRGLPFWALGVLLLVCVGALLYRVALASLFWSWRLSLFLIVILVAAPRITLVAFYRAGRYASWYTGHCTVYAGHRCVILVAAFLVILVITRFILVIARFIILVTAFPGILVIVPFVLDARFIILVTAPFIFSALSVSE